MKILFIADYFFPHEVSGAEVSVRLLVGKLAQKKGIEVAIITSGFKNDPLEDIQDGVKVYRYPFGDQFSGVSFAPGKVTNPLFWVYSAWRIYGRCRIYKPDILHVQGKNHLIGAFLANIFLRKKILYTARDYRPLCDLGMCLSRGNIVCSPVQYLLKDVPLYIKNFTSGGLISIFKAYAIALLNLPIRQIYKFVLKNISKVICISKAEEKIYNSSGISNTEAIYNTCDINFSDIPKQKQIYYGGKYSLGKGALILDEVLPQFLDKHKDWKVVMVGDGGPKWQHSRLVHLGKVTYKQVVAHHSQSAFSLVPSTWPEPFGRAALDSLAVGTPVLCSSRGGLPEIIENNRYGLVLDPTASGFSQGIEIALKEYPQWQKQIRQDEKKLNEKFSEVPVKEHINIYQSLIS